VLVNTQAIVNIAQFIPIKHSREELRISDDTARGFALAPNVGSDHSKVHYKGSNIAFKRES
jgi:hypothetical protein